VQKILSVFMVDHDSLINRKRGREEREKGGKMLGGWVMVITQGLYILCEKPNQVDNFINAQDRMVHLLSAKGGEGLVIEIHVE